MGLKSIDSDGGYAKFGKGDNAFIRVKEINPETEPESYQGDEYFQIEFKFDAVNEADTTQRGEIPAWITSKLTVTDSEEHTSNMAKLLQSAGVLEDVLLELLGEEELVDMVINGEERWEADNAEENQKLGKAIVPHLKDKVVKTGTKHNAKGDYSIAKDFYGPGDEDVFEDSEDSEEESGEDSDSGSNTIFDSGEDEEE